MENAPRKSKTMMIVIIMLVVAVAAVAATAAFFLLRPAPTASALEVDANVVTGEGSNMQDLLAEMQKAADASTVMTEYYSTINVGAGMEGTTYMGNPASNSCPVVFTLAVSGEEIYRSGLVPVGSHLETIKLGKTLAAGTHEAVLYYRLMDESTGEELSSAAFAVTLVVGA